MYILFSSAFKEGWWWKKCLLTKKSLELPFKKHKILEYPLSCLAESDTASIVLVCINFYKSFSGSPGDSKKPQADPGKKTQANDGLNFILLTHGR